MAPSGQAGLRERKKGRVRADLQRAALDLFAAKGFRAVSVDEIAVRADVSRSTFFRYFPSKEAVVFAGYDEAGAALADLLSERPLSEDPLTAFENAQISLIEKVDLPEQRSIATARERLLASDPVLRARHGELIKMWQSRIAQMFADRERVTDPHESHHLAAAVCIAVVTRVSEKWWESGAGTDVRALLHEEFASLRRLVMH